jgi:RNAse (barnase) inhibitor barstar
MLSLSGRVFQQLWLSAPLLHDLFRYPYEQTSYRDFSRKTKRSFNLAFRYIEDVLSLNNCMFGDFVDRIYPIQLEIKDNTYTDRSAYIFRCIDVVEETGVPMENHRPGASH